MVKNPSTRPSQNYYLGPLSESVHEMDGLSPKSWSVVHMDRWTDGRSADGRLRPRRPAFDQTSDIVDALDSFSSSSISASLKININLYVT